MTHVILSLLLPGVPANAHPPGLGLSSPQPDTDHPARCALGALVSSPALDVRLMTALQVLQVLSGRRQPQLRRLRTHTHLFSCDLDN